MTMPAAPPATDPAAAASDASSATGSSGDIAVVLMVPEDVATGLPVIEGTDPAPLFMTLAFLAKPDTIDSTQFLIAVLGAVRDAATAGQPIGGQINGLGRISGADSDQDEVFALVESPDLEPLRSALVEGIESANGGDTPAPDGTAAAPMIDPGTYLPKITLGTVGTTADLPFQRIEPVACSFGTLTLVQDTTLIEVPIGPADSRPDVPDPNGTAVDNALAGGPPDTTAPSAGDATKGKGKPPSVGRGSYVKVGSQQGRVDMVVASGKVPGTDSDIEGSEANPALRVVVYTESNGKWKATGKRIAARANSAQRIAPLMNRPAKKGLGVEALVDLQAEHEVKADEAGWPDHARPDGEALIEVFERGVKSWPGADATTLGSQDWALHRVKAFLSTAAGDRPDGYVRDDDLLPEGHPERKGSPAEGTDQVVLDPDEVKSLVSSFRT